MRPTGMLHLGHYFLLQKWVAMQDECDCNFFIADYHALTTSESTDELGSHISEMLVCWLAAGIDPERSVIFLQSQLHEHAELHLLLSMVTPLPWLERVPHYKDTVAKLGNEGVNYGFLGYPVLQAADIIMHAADLVPVGDDQEAHVELAARIARSFNERFGKETDWQAKGQALVDALADPKKFLQLCRQANQEGDEAARAAAVQMVIAAGLERKSTQRLLGWTEDTGRQILKPPRSIKAEVSRLPGLDGKVKMSKSEQNDISMLEEKESFSSKISVMPTDPARVRRDDPGDPEKCPVWDYHKLFSSSAECEQVTEGCTSASMGCRDCKNMLSDNIEKVVAPLRERAEPWRADSAKVMQMLHEGNDKARQSAKLTMKEVKAAVGLAQL